MAGGIRYGLPAQSMMMILCGEGRMRMQYENGERTDKRVLSDGKPVLRYPALFSVDGQSVLGVGSLDTTSDLAGTAFGEILRGLPGHMAEVAVSPGGQFEVRLTVTVDSVVPAKPLEEAKS